jgi:subtilisin family serine protease
MHLLRLLALFAGNLRRLWVLFIAGSGFFCTVHGDESSAAPVAHPTRLLVQPKPGKDLRRLHQDNGNRLVRKIGGLDLDLVETCKEGGVCAMIDRYSSHPDVDFAEPDYIVHAAVLPNDPAFASGSLWNLRNSGQRGGMPGADIQAAAAWSAVRHAYNVIVAVIDSGVRFSHEDLAANMWRNPGEIAGNNIDDDRNGYADDLFGINAITGSGIPWDDYGHGTHVAGIIGAVGDNGRGSVGVAWRVRIMACKFMDSAGRGAISDAIESIEYARKHGASIINLSWGGTSHSAALQKAISAARNEGIIFVAAAGNQASNNDVRPFYPASLGLDNIISVAASTRHDLLAIDYSNFGQKSVHLAAPGSDIYSTWNTGDDSYAVLSGTSMAAPHVAGLLALLKVRFPQDSYQRQIQRVLWGTDPVASLRDRSVTGGRVNMRKSLGLPTPAANPAAPRISLASGRTPANYRYRVTGQPGKLYAIEASQNLRSWTPVLTNRAWSDGTLYFSDPSHRAFFQRYYRARLVPETGAN